MVFPAKPGCLRRCCGFFPSCYGGGSLSSRGLSRIATVLLGSTAERVAGLCDGPLLVVRRKGEVIGLLEGLFHR